MKIRHAIAIGLFVVGLSAAYVLYARGYSPELATIVAAVTVLIAVPVASGKCCIGKRCFGKSAGQGGAWQHWM